MAGELLAKFKRTKKSAIEQTEKELTKKTFSGKSNNDSKWAKFLSLEEGKTYLRILPAHPTDSEEGGMYYLPVTRSSVPYVYEKKDSEGNVLKDKKGNPLTEVSRKRVFNAKVHGEAEFDIVEEYIKAVRNKADQICETEDEKKEYLEAIEGNFFKKIEGIVPKTSYASYVAKISGDSYEVLRWDYSYSIKEGLASVAESEEDENEPMEYDPFTDIEEGLAVVITKDSAKPGKDRYDVKAYKPKGATKGTIKTYPIPEETLKEFLKYPSLESLFKNSYKKKDLEIAVAGLDIFDRENNYGIFEDDEFMAKVEEAENFWTAVEENAAKSSKSESPKSNTSVKSAPQQEDDEEEEEEEDVEEEEEEKNPPRTTARRPTPPSDEEEDEEAEEVANSQKVNSLLSGLRKK